MADWTSLLMKGLCNADRGFESPRLRSQAPQNLMFCGASAFSQSLKHCDFRAPEALHTPDLHHISPTSRNRVLAWADDRQKIKQSLIFLHRAAEDHRRVTLKRQSLPNIEKATTTHYVYIAGFCRCRS